MSESILIIRKDRLELCILGAGAVLCGLFSLKGLHIPYWIFIPIVLAGTFVLFLWSKEKPQILLYALAAYLPFAKQLHFRFGPVSDIVNLTNLLILMVLYLWKQNKFELPGKLKPFSFFEICFMVFLGLILLSILGGFLLGPNYLASALLQCYTSWGIPFILFLMFKNISGTREMIKNLILIIIAVTTLVAGMASLEYLLTGERVGGVFDHANLLSSFFSYYMFLPIAFFILEFQNKSYWLFMVSFLILSRGIMVAFSRGGYAAFAASTYVLAFFRNKWFFVLLLALSVIVVTNPVLLPPGVRYRLGKTFEKNKMKNGNTYYTEEKLDRSSADRLEIWKGAIQMIKDNPLTGVGYTRFMKKIEHYWYAGISFEPHNTFLWLGAELGVPAALLFIVMIIALGFKSFLAYTLGADILDRGLGLGFLACIAGFIVSNLYAPRLDYPEVGGYFWMLAGLLYRLSHLNKSETT